MKEKLPIRLNKERAFQRIPIWLDRETSFEHTILMNRETLDKMISDNRITYADTFRMSIIPNVFKNKDNDPDRWLIFTMGKQTLSWLEKKEREQRAVLKNDPERNSNQIVV